jgi:predicted transcriptional regulator
MKRSRIARISMTLPADLLRQTDQEAKRLGRSRSWVIAEALRRMQAGTGAAPGVVREAWQFTRRWRSPAIDGSGPPWR